MSTLLSTITQIVGSVVSWVGSFMGCITTSGNEILLLFVVLPVVGFGVGLIKRLLSL